MKNNPYSLIWAANLVLDIAANGQETKSYNEYRTNFVVFLLLSFSSRYQPNPQQFGEASRVVLLLFILTRQECGRVPHIATDDGKISPAEIIHSQFVIVPVPERREGPRPQPQALTAVPYKINGSLTDNGNPIHLPAALCSLAVKARRRTPAQRDHTHGGPMARSTIREAPSKAISRCRTSQQQRFELVLSRQS